MNRRSTIWLLKYVVSLGMMVVSLMAHSEPLGLNNNLSVVDAIVSLKVLPPRYVIWPPAKQTELPNVVAENPSETNFVPKVLIMTGKLREIRTTGYPIEWCGDSFELAVLDSTNYYYKEWRDQKDKTLGQCYGSVVYVIQGDSAARWFCFQPRSGAGADCSGGRFAAISMGDILPARNLWINNVFTGVTSENLTFRKFGTEEYFDLEKFGPYFLPRKISITTGSTFSGKLTKEYTVERILFAKKLNVLWLDEVNERHSKAVNFPVIITDVNFTNNPAPNK